MAEALALNARIGKTRPRDAVTQGASPVRTTHARLATAPTLLVVLLLSLWPHGAWMARRLTDGSDEPWGILAIVTVLLLVGREWRRLKVPGSAALVASGALALTAAIARLWLPPLLAAAIAMAALAVFLAGARRDRPVAPLATLLLLALPIIASLQFYFGYPLRVVTAAAAAPILQALGFAAEATGAAFAYDGRLVLVDPPCAGIGMLWLGGYVAALLSYFANATWARTAVNGVFAASCVFVANVARNVALFIPEGLQLAWPQWTHAFIGLVAFACALLPIVLFVQRRARSAPSAWPVWPARYHRRPV